MFSDSARYNKQQNCAVLPKAKCVLFRIDDAGPVGLFFANHWKGKVSILMWRHAPPDK